MGYTDLSICARRSSHICLTLYVTESVMIFQFARLVYGPAHDQGGPVVNYILGRASRIYAMMANALRESTQRHSNKKAAKRLSRRTNVRSNDVFPIRESNPGLPRYVTERRIY